jgi:hypothetical protein
MSDQGSQERFIGASHEGGAPELALAEGPNHGGGAHDRISPVLNDNVVAIAETHSLGQLPPSQLTAPLANPSSNVAMLNFSFGLPFTNPVQAETSRITQQGAVASVSSSQPTASQDLRLGGDHSSGSSVLFTSFEALSARAFAKLIGDKIQSFNPELWIAEDVSGAAFLEVVTPSSLSEFLEHTMLVGSLFQRTRIANFIRARIASDNFLSESVKKCWAVPALPESASVQAPSVCIGNTLSPVLPAALFQTPAKEQFNGASFLSEIKGRVGFTIDESALFQSDSSTLRATVTGNEAASGQSMVSHATPHGSTPRFEVVINQPSADKPKYLVLSTVDNEEEFAKWLKKNREETVLALPVDRRPLTHLVTKDCKEEISRVIVSARTDDPGMFDADCPYPKNGWPDVTDKLLLRVLFKKNGPPSADAAKEWLKKIRFFFNDSTTHQKFFTAKFRKHCKRFTSGLHDFDYVHRLWPEHDKVLSHAMIIDAFSDGFNDTSTVVGPDKSTQVPKCSNLAKIREFIRQRKACPLEDIICELVRHFERLDTTIRSNSKVMYDVTPWRSEAATVSKKRKYNQIDGSAGSAAVNAVSAKQPRPAAPYSRCNNCGSKGHLCGEKTCFLFGHPKAKGPNGDWPEGTPSLRLAPDEYKAWSTTRKPIFFAYPENKGSKQTAT